MIVLTVRYAKNAAWLDALLISGSFELDVTTLMVVEGAG
jgi:hypothetical protein